MSATAIIPFYSDCVDWDRDKLAALEYLVDEGVKIRRATFMRRAARPFPIEPCPAGTPYGDDFYTLPGMPVYWFVHSAIEYVFAEPETIRAVQERAREGNAS